MGKSKSIQDQQKANQEFQEYVEKISKDMGARQDKMSEVLERMEHSTSIHICKVPSRLFSVKSKKHFNQFTQSIHIVLYFVM